MLLFVVKWGNKNCDDASFLATHCHDSFLFCLLASQIVYTQIVLKKKGTKQFSLRSRFCSFEATSNILTQVNIENKYAVEQHIPAE